MRTAEDSQRPLRSGASAYESEAGAREHQPQPEGSSPLSFFGEPPPGLSPPGLSLSCGLQPSALDWRSAGVPQACCRSTPSSEHIQQHQQPPRSQSEPPCRFEQPERPSSAKRNHYFHELRRQTVLKELDSARAKIDRLLLWMRL